MDKLNLCRRSEKMIWLSGWCMCLTRKTIEECSAARLYLFYGLGYFISYAIVTRPNNTWAYVLHTNTIKQCKVCRGMCQTCYQKLFLHTICIIGKIGDKTFYKAHILEVWWIGLNNTFSWLLLVDTYLTSL